jgi:hypothetical protein
MLFHRHDRDCRYVCKPLAHNSTQLTTHFRPIPAPPLPPPPRCCRQLPLTKYLVLVLLESYKGMGIENTHKTTIVCESNLSSINRSQQHAGGVQIRICISTSLVRERSHSTAQQRCATPCSEFRIPPTFPSWIVDLQSVRMPVPHVHWHNGSTVYIFKQVLSKEKEPQGCKRVRQIIPLTVTTPLFFFARSIAIRESIS